MCLSRQCCSQLIVLLASLITPWLCPVVSCQLVTPCDKILDSKENGVSFKFVLFQFVSVFVVFFFFMDHCTVHPLCLEQGDRSISGEGPRVMFTTYVEWPLSPVCPSVSPHHWLGSILGLLEVLASWTWGARGSASGLAWLCSTLSCHPDTCDCAPPTLNSSVDHRPFGLTGLPWSVGKVCPRSALPLPPHYRSDILRTDMLFLLKSKCKYT